MLKYYTAIYSGALLTVMAQLMLKKGAIYKGKKYFIFHLYLNIYVFLGYFLFFMVTLFTLYGLQKVRLVEMVVINPLVHLLVVISSIVFFKEKINKNQCVGILLILFGILIFHIKGICLL